MFGGQSGQHADRKPLGHRKLSGGMFFNGRAQRELPVADTPARFASRQVLAQSACLGGRQFTVEIAVQQNLEVVAAHHDSPL